MRINNGQVSQFVVTARLGSTADLSEFALKEPPPLAIDGISVIQQTGSDANRIDIVFLGDGYTASEIGNTYLDDVDALVSYLFDGGIMSEPFDRYRNFFNIYAVNLISNESGADNPSTETIADTALNATYYWDGVTERLLYIDETLGNAALSQALSETSIHADIAFVTVNSALYGGGGGPFTVYAGGNSTATDIALHELAHSFARLADEYTSAGTGGVNGSVYSGPEPDAANVTISESGEKWSQWLGYDQPGIGIIGAYEGAQYYSSGLYRPSYNSKMRELGNPFDAIARERFILEFYKHVHPIDSATPGTDLNDPTALHVEVIDPAIIGIRWSLDGAVVSDTGLETFVFENFNVASGTHSVEALAYDATDWVRLDRSSLEQQVDWTVTLTHATLHSDGVHPLVGGVLSDTLIASAEPDSLSGGAGVDTLSYALSDASVSVSLAGNTVSGGYAAGDAVSAFENVTGSAFPDRLTGNSGANVLNGGPGDDRLYAGSGGDVLNGGAGADVLTGGAGTDRFVFAIADALDGATITDFDADDIIDLSYNDPVFGDDGLVTAFIGTDAFSGTAGEYRYYNDGNKTYVQYDSDGDATADGTLTIANGAFKLEELTHDVGDWFLYDPSSSHALVRADPAQSFILAIPDDGAVTVAGDGQVIGTGGVQDVTVLDAPGRITFDASFNAGRDRIRLSGDAANYTVTRDGSTIEIGDGDTTVAVRAGLHGADIIFADGSRTITVDAASSLILLGDQAVTDAPATITAPAEEPSATGATDPDAVTRMLMAEDGAAAVGGNVFVFGTSDGHESVTLLAGSNAVFDGSFNAGGDTIALAGDAGDYEAVRSGSTIILTEGGGRIDVPVGPAATTIAFADGARDLYFDPDTGTIMLGTQQIGGTAEPLDPAALAVGAMMPMV